MFWHNFKFSLKTLLGNKILVFWTLAFPILLGIFFYMAFSDIEKNEKLNVIPIAVIKSDFFEEDIVMKEALSNLGKEGEDSQLFDISYVNEDTAKRMLADKKVTGYIDPVNDYQIVVFSNGIEQTIIKYTIDEIRSYQKMIENLTASMIESEIKSNGIVDYMHIKQEVQKMVNANSKQQIKDISNSHMSYMMVEYYTLIAMACLYGGILSMTAMNYKLANMSGVGRRCSICPTSKSKLLFGSLAASYFVQLFGLLLLFLFTIFVLKVDYGTHLFEMFLLACAGSFAGLSLGVFVAVMFKTNENAKTGILIAFTMLGCFLSGMMGVTMKYVIDKNVGFLNKINPASMITDGFYSLYYYDGSRRFIFNLCSLFIFSFIILLISLHGLRRQKYDSI